MTACILEEELDYLCNLKSGLASQARGRNNNTSKNNKRNKVCGLQNIPSVDGCLAVVSPVHLLSVRFEKQLVFASLLDRLISLKNA